jgi:hypothetical protein
MYKSQCCFTFYIRYYSFIQKMRKNIKNPQILPPSILIHQQQHTFKQVINSVDEK